MIQVWRNKVKLFLLFLKPLLMLWLHKTFNNQLLNKIRNYILHDEEAEAEVEAEVGVEVEAEVEAEVKVGGCVFVDVCPATENILSKLLSGGNTRRVPVLLLTRRPESERQEK